MYTAVCILLWSFVKNLITWLHSGSSSTLRWDAHRRAWLLGMMHTALSDFAGLLTRTIKLFNTVFSCGSFLATVNILYSIYCNILWFKCSCLYTTTKYIPHQEGNNCLLSNISCIISPYIVSWQLCSNILILWTRHFNCWMVNSTKRCLPLPTNCQPVIQNRQNPLF